MTAVSGDPSAMNRWADQLREGAAALARAADHLDQAVAEFAASPSDVAPISWVSFPSDLRSEEGSARRLAAGVDDFGAALLLADRAGLATTGTAPGRRVLGVTAGLWAWTQRVDPAVLRRWAVVERSGGFGSDGLTAVRAQLEQLATMADPAHRGWAGVDDDVDLRSDQLADDLAESGRAVDELRRAGAEWPDDHPFLHAATEHGVIITTARLEVLLLLDDLFTAETADFVDRAAAASDERLDWSTDGCSGPVPAVAADACLRHDFVYRNARMLRDQWGIDAAFAQQLKETADRRFGADMEQLAASGDAPIGTGPWTWVAEAAVTHLGDVDARWEPPERVT